MVVGIGLEGSPMMPTLAAAAATGSARRVTAGTRMEVIVCEGTRMILDLVRGAMAATAWGQSPVRQENFFICLTCAQASGV